MRLWHRLRAAALTGFAAGGMLMADQALAQSDSGFSDPPPACGDTPLTIAALQWPSAQILAHIHADILRDQYGCTVEVVPGDMTATLSSMASTGQPSVAPEMWIDRVADIWNSALAAGTVRQGGPAFAEGAMEGWFIPQFVAANHPDLKRAADLSDYWQVFRPDGAEKAIFLSCPADWACSVINRNLLNVLGLDNRFEIVEPADRLALDNRIGEAMSRHEPVLFYYWQPNAVLGQFDFKALDMGDYRPDAAKCMALRTCIALEPSAFAPEPVVNVMSAQVLTDAPQIAGYFRVAQMPLPTMNALLAWQHEQGASAEDTAAHFIATSGDIWRPWLALH